MVLFDAILRGNNVFVSTLRGSKMAAWLRIVIFALSEINNRFEQFRTAKTAELRYNGQVIYLEKLLNDRFDNTLRRISIADPTPLTASPPIIFNYDDEALSIAQYGAIINNFGQLIASDSFLIFNYTDLQSPYDFVVNVPSVLASQQIAIQKTVGQYKEASKVFQIILI